MLPRHTIYDRLGELVGVLGTLVLVGHWSSPKTLEAGWLNAITSKLEHNIARQVAIRARNPSDTKS